jgi:hypothetical protein
MERIPVGPFCFADREAAVETDGRTTQPAAKCNINQMHIPYYDYATIC